MINEKAISEAQKISDEVKLKAEAEKEKIEKEKNSNNNQENSENSVTENTTKIDMTNKSHNDIKSDVGCEHLLRARLEAMARELE